MPNFDEKTEGESKIFELQRALSKVNVNILGLCETRREGDDMIELEDGSLLCWNGTKGERGTGFWVDKTWKAHIEEYYAKSDRISTIRIKINRNTSLKIVQVNAPTSASSDEQLEDFYDDVQRSA